MKFGEIPVAEAAGALLGHSVRHGGGVFRKGRVLSSDDVRALIEAGVERIMGARFEDGDVGEDEAAAAVAAALAGPHLEAAAAFTGRANLYADIRGLALVDARRIHALNRLGEALTVATVAPFERVEERQMVATVKVIPFALERALLDRALDLCRAQAPALSVASFTVAKVGLVLSELPGTKERLLDKSRQVLSDRVEDLGGSVVSVATCPHETEEIAAALRQAVAAGAEVVLVLGASAIVDRNDVIPAGVRAAGGEVDHLGMPVDPGNLLMLGRLQDASVVGVPSCARSPKTNGFDWVLQRLMAGLKVSGDDVQAMGVGGLLKEIASRPQPRDPGVAAPAAKSAARIAALVLAAGRSTRMGEQNKLLLEVARKPMVRHVAEAISAAQVTEVVVVTGHQAEQVEAALEGLDVRFARNPDYAAGLSTSLRVGLEALDKSVDGVLVCLGDMPAVKAEHIDRLIAAFNPAESRAICVPLTDGKRGNPVLWAREYFDEMASVKGDVGARHLIGAHVEKVCEVPIADDAVLTDIDTPAMFDELRQGAEVD